MKKISERKRRREGEGERERERRERKNSQFARDIFCEIFFPPVVNRYIKTIYEYIKAIYKIIYGILMFSPFSFSVKTSPALTIVKKNTDTTVTRKPDSNR